MNNRINLFVLRLSCELSGVLWWSIINANDIQNKPALRYRKQVQHGGEQFTMDELCESVVVEIAFVTDSISVNCCVSYK